MAGLKNIFKFSKIPLFYWSSVRFEGKNKENYGDLLSKYLTEKISQREVKWVQPKKLPWFNRNKVNYVGIGSIIHHSNKNSIVWGSGIIDQQQNIASADFRAVRGPYTRDFLISLGYDCPEIYGDPALLLPVFYNPEIKKKYTFGILPHYVDYEFVKNLCKEDSGLRIIDMLTDNIEQTTNEILECENIISSSLHGIIIAHAYNIPAKWVKFSDKIFGDNIKYKDYLKSVGLEIYNPEDIKTYSQLQVALGSVNEKTDLPVIEKILSIQKDLMISCPFRF